METHLSDHHGARRLDAKLSIVALSLLGCLTVGVGCSDKVSLSPDASGSTTAPNTAGGATAGAAAGATSSTTTAAAGTTAAATAGSGGSATAPTSRAGSGGSGGGSAAVSSAAGSSGSSTAAAAGASSQAGSSGAAGAASPSAGGGCTRANLKAAVDSYFAALSAHSTDKLPLAANVKYTENAKKLMPGEGVWKTAGALKFKRTAVDTMTCQTATESVIPDGSQDRVYGVRLKLDADGKISEIEGILVTDYILIMPAGLVNSKSDDWETELPADKQMPRDKMQAVMDKYLKEFPSGACGFADSCKRLEDGGSVGTCVDGSLVSCNMMDRPNMNVLKPLNHVMDLEAGIVVGFTVFLGGYDDFHLFKMRDGKVQQVHAVLTQTDSKTGWE